jgi:hypothetical protein
MEVVVAAIALYYLRKTYWETRRTARASANSARAANRALIIARETASADRAWITTRGVRTRIFKPARFNNIGYSAGVVINVKWINSGRTPAVNCQFFAERLVRPRDHPTGSPFVVPFAAGTVALAVAASVLYEHLLCAAVRSALGGLFHGRQFCGTLNSPDS